ncbi:hypothetical protein GCK72_024729 [Caenorhabditis remanei]|uniref:Ionotropic glutamate receptor L-glutamate and glycine-binding domain-containing protein n=1 Tax=Caenorhabditis remanei TaxID=31234 RepID=A0A6A5G0S5_CAERE|nr:hypothetical protein GCK72_024729 [Caenorhabditis remanei]KAF1748262.1 hypothetical protein GCK72_024729 [Caenorhabditis remanei]
MTNIRIGAFPLEKDAQTCFELPSCKHPGAEVEILKMVFRLIGVNYTVIDVWKEFGEVYDFGAKQADGNWSGMIGLLQKDKLDMIGLSMRISSDREEAVLFSYPTRVFQSVFVIAPPTFTCTRQFIFNAFSRTVWLFIVFFVLLLYLSDLLINYFKLKGVHPDKPIHRLFLDLFSTNISLYNISARVLLLVILITTFLLSQLYQTDMYAYLSAPLTFAIPFRTTKEALDVVEKKKMYFAAYENQTFLCTQSICNRYQQVIKKNPVRRAFREKEVQNLITNGGIYQSTVDSALLPGQLSWLNEKQKYLIIRDEDAPSYYVAYSFSKKYKKMVDKFNSALIEVLPAVSLITTGHGYNTRKIPFEVSDLQIYGISSVVHNKI